MPSCKTFKVSNTLFLLFTKKPLIKTGVPKLFVALKAILLINPSTKVPPSGKTSTLVLGVVLLFILESTPLLIEIYFSYKKTLSSFNIQRV